MKTKGIMVVFGLIAAVHLAAPLSMIWKREAVLKQGTRLLIQTQPVDPYDVFRGRYVRLNYDPLSVPDHGTLPVRRGDQAFAQYRIDEDGFVQVTNIIARLETGDEIPVVVQSVHSGRIHARFPFDRLYLNETLAPRAEAAYRSANQADGGQAWVRVRVHKGRAVLEDLMIEGLPVHNYMQQTPDGS